MLKEILYWFLWTSGACVWFINLFLSKKIDESSRKKHDKYIDSMFDGLKKAYERDRIYTSKILKSRKKRMRYRKYGVTNVK